MKKNLLGNYQKLGKRIDERLENSDVYNQINNNVLPIAFTAADVLGLRSAAFPLLNGVHQIVKLKTGHRSIVNGQFNESLRYIDADGNICVRY